MTEKQDIVSELGAEELLAPGQIARALVANDVVKYYFALLQTAKSNADQPRAPVPDLKAEQLASRIDDEWLDDVVAGARKLKGHSYQIPQGDKILSRIVAGIVTMLDCLPSPQRQPLLDRLRRAPLPSPDHGAIAGRVIDAMTSGDRSAGDSLHLLVMDAHRAINALQAATAAETINGARVHNLSKKGRTLVRSFMEGLNRTAPLKFDHPGLGTTATEHEGRLLIQNDIGTTDAHVLVIHVEGLKATLTYTDVHKRRLKFFQSLFDGRSVKWEQTGARSSEKPQLGSYLLTTGVYGARDHADLAHYLEHLGSRIVFLIDWNHTRKRLRAFVDQDRCVAALKWAADNEFGHRGLLEIGGEKALAEVVEYAAGDRLHYGDRLDALIGADHAAEFLRNAMKCASVGLRRRRSRRAILDEIKADLRQYFESARLAIFDIAARHAACGYDLAVSLCETLQRLGGPDGEGRTVSLAARAVVWEASADGLLNQAREEIKRFGRSKSLRAVFESADDAVDEMEEAASIVDLAKLVPGDGLPHAALVRLADLTLASAQEFVKCVECAAGVTSADVRDDLDDFLQCLERLIEIEHDADESMRTLRRATVASAPDHRSLYLTHQLSKALESATDAYLHAGQALRAYLMDEVLA